MLFTRKKQQAIPSAETEETESTPNKTETSKKKGVIQALTDETLENQETEVQGAASNPATTSNSINLDKTGFEKPAGKKRGRKSKAEKEQLEREKRGEQQPKITEMLKFPTSSWRGPNAGPSSCVAAESFKVPSFYRFSLFSFSRQIKILSKAKIFNQVQNFNHTLFIIKLKHCHFMR